LDGDDGSAGERGQVSLYVNMVFQLPVEFGLPEQEVAQLALGLREQSLRSLASSDIT
jgi:hypothetical protein